jgi:hypothetical protein
MDEVECFHDMKSVNPELANYLDVDNHHPKATKHWSLLWLAYYGVGLEPEPGTETASTASHVG